MTIDDLFRYCQSKKIEGKGDWPVIWESLSHSWPVEPKETTRGGKPVILINP
jgi:hypothetical protein